MDRLCRVYQCDYCDYTVLELFYDINTDNYHDVDMACDSNARQERNIKNSVCPECHNTGFHCIKVKPL